MGKLFQSAPAAMRRENLSNGTKFYSYVKFQSAPAAMRRENAGFAATAFAIISFNPLPPQCGGRICDGRCNTSIDDVSIRSRRNAAGEYGSTVLGHRALCVSIRSRRNAAGE